MITGSVSVRSIDWTETVGDDLINTADVVIVCDCVYYEASLQPLINTMNDILNNNNNNNSGVLLAYEHREDPVV